MSEKEVEVTGEETAKGKQSSSKQASQVAKKTKAASKESPSELKKPTAIEEIMTTIKNMTVLELAELVKALETEFGVSAAVPAAVATTAVPVETEGAAPAAAEEPTEFSVILKDIGANKISVIKAVRELTTLGLKEAKDLVESAPATVKEGISKEEVTTVKQKLEDAGATVEIK